MRPRADLRGEADALALAAGERAGIAVQGEVGEADIVEEAEALADLLEDALGDRRLLGVELVGQLVEPGGGLADRELGHLADVPPADLDRERLGLEPVAAAGGARRRRHVALDLLAHPGTVGLAPAPLEVRDDALEGLVGLHRPQAILKATSG